MKELIEKVIDQMGGIDMFEENAKDITEYGAACGFSGFIYYNDTLNFYEKNRVLIIKLLQNYADDFGSTIVDFILSFNCLKDNVTRGEIESFLIMPDVEAEFYTIIANSLSWFALEEAARYYVDTYEGSLT